MIYYTPIVRKLELRIKGGIKLKKKVEIVCRINGSLVVFAYSIFLSNHAMSS